MKVEIINAELCIKDDEFEIIRFSCLPSGILEIIKKENNDVLVIPFHNIVKIEKVDETRFVYVKHFPIKEVL